MDENSDVASEFEPASGRDTGQLTGIALAYNYPTA
jgi:hypothetical protein